MSFKAIKELHKKLRAQFLDPVGGILTHCNRADCKESWIVLVAHDPHARQRYVSDPSLPDVPQAVLARQDPLNPGTFSIMRIYTRAQWADEMAYMLDVAAEKDDAGLGGMVYAASDLFREYLRDVKLANQEATEREAAERARQEAAEREAAERAKLPRYLQRKNPPIYPRLRREVERQRKPVKLDDE